MSNGEHGLDVGNAQRVSKAALLLMILAAVVGTAVVFFATPYGLSLRDDSYSYVAGAISLAEGTGFGRLTGDGSVNPITNFPPLYSLALAVPVAVGIDAYPFARMMNSALFGLTVLVAAAAVHRATHSIGYMAFASGIVIGSGTLIEQHTWVQSEPLFICLQFVALVSIGSYVHRPSGRGLLWMAAAASALATYTRFVGVSLILACCLVLLLLHRKPFVTRAREAGLLLLVGVTPLIGFTIRNLAVKGSAANRPAPFWHPPSADAWQGAFVLMLKWLLPDRIAAFLTDSTSMSLVTALALALAATWLGLRLANKMRALPSSDSILSHLSVQGMFCLSYLFVIVLTVLYLDRLTPLDERILAPLHLSIFVTIALGAAYLSRRSSGRRRWSIGVVCVAFAAFHILRSALIVEALAAEGHGYASDRWRMSPTLAYARGLPDAPIFTNNLPAMYFVAGRTTFAIPAPTNLSNLEANSDYARELSEMRQLLRESGGYLVYVGYTPTDRQGAEEFETLTSGLVPVQELTDGTVYKAEK